MLGYAIGAALFDTVGRRVLELYGAQEQFAAVRDRFGASGWLWVLVAGFTPLPFKVVTIAAGATGLPLPVLLGAAAVSRAGRFFLVAGLLRWLGEPARVFLERHFGLVTIAFAVVGIAGFVAVRYLVVIGWWRDRTGPATSCRLSFGSSGLDRHRAVDERVLLVGRHRLGVDIGVVDRVLAGLSGLFDVVGLGLRLVGGAVAQRVVALAATGGERQGSGQAGGGDQCLHGRGLLLGEADAPARPCPGCPAHLPRRRWIAMIRHQFGSRNGDSSPMITAIREVRRAKGLTLADVAGRCDPPTTAQTIGRLETGTRTVSVGWLNRIAAALGVEASDLVQLPDQERVSIAARLGTDGAHAPTKPLSVKPPQPRSGDLAVAIDVSVGDWRAGDTVWMERLDASGFAGALNRDVLVPRPAGRFAFGRMIGREGDRMLVLPPGSGSRQQVVTDPAWIAVARLLVREL